MPGSSSVGTATALLMQDSRARGYGPSLTPSQCYPDIAGIAARPLDHLEANFIALGTELTFVELVDFPRYPGKSVRPSLFRLGNRAAAIGAQLVRKTINQHLSQTVRNGALDDPAHTPERLLVRDARRSCKVFQQSSFFGFGSSALA